MHFKVFNVVECCKFFTFLVFKSATLRICIYSCFCVCGVRDIGRVKWKRESIVYGPYVYNVK